MLVVICQMAAQQGVGKEAPVGRWAIDVAVRVDLWSGLKGAPRVTWACRVSQGAPTDGANPHLPPDTKEIRHATTRTRPWSCMLRSRQAVITFVLRDEVRGLCAAVW